MEFPYNPRKAAQAAAYLVRLNGGLISVLSLIKLLYLADRKALSRRGRPITGDRFVSMPHGPVLSRIYDEIQWGERPGQDQLWYQYLTERQGHNVGLRQANLAVDELSEFERQVLEETHQEYGRFGPWQLREITHNLPEYQDPAGSSLPIDPVIILREAGWSDEDIQEALMSSREERFLRQVTTGGA
jgi:uncharacterized phage-associated protein